MIQVRARIVNLDDVRRGHERLLADNERMLVDAEELAGRHAESHVRQYATFKRRSGKLQDATTHRVVRTSGGRLLKIANPQKYAGPINAGARRHEIRAKRKRFLRFYSKKLGRIVFVRRVQHPGNKPYKFLFRATTSAYRVLGEELRRRMAEIAARF